MSYLFIDDSSPQSSNLCPFPTILFIIEIRLLGFATIYGAPNIENSAVLLSTLKTKAMLFHYGTEQF